MKQSTISKQLGVTDAGIECLCKAVAHKEGHAFGAGQWRGQGARDRLMRQGYIDFEHVITDAGRAIVKRARRMGW